MGRRLRAPGSRRPDVLRLRAAAHDPAAVRRVFLDNAANYRKDELQLRMLRPGLGNGLLTAEGEAWRVQRRALAPLFSPRQVAGFAPPMHRVGAPPSSAFASGATGRWRMSARSWRASLWRCLSRRCSRKGSDATQRVPARGDALFRDHRPYRSARRAGRARFRAAESAACAAAAR